MKRKLISVLILLSIQSFAFAADRYSAFGYTVNKELTNKNLKVLKKDDQLTTYRIPHKKVGSLTNFYITVVTHGKPLITEIIAESKLFKTREQCENEIGSLRAALKKKYGTSYIKDGDGMLSAACDSQYNKSWSKLLGYKIQFRIASFDALDYSRNAYKKWRIKKANSGDASKYNGL